MSCARPLRRGISPLTPCRTRPPHILDTRASRRAAATARAGRVLVVRDPADRGLPRGARRARGQALRRPGPGGRDPWNTIDPTAVTADHRADSAAPALTESLRPAPVVLVVCVDLKVVASTDQALPRVGVISGASIYPFVWNILLAARHEGLAGPSRRSRSRRSRSSGAPGAAPARRGRRGDAAWPARRSLTKLKRKPVSEIAMHERWGGAPLTG